MTHKVASVFGGFPIRTQVLVWFFVLTPLYVLNAKQPNIVIIYTDDHAQHAVSAYGSQINSTPNIDALAREGMRFTQSFVLVGRRY